MIKKMALNSYTCKYCVTSSKIFNGVITCHHDEISLHFEFLFAFLFGVYHPTREFFTHMEMSPLPVKGCKFLPMLGTHGH